MELGSNFELDVTTLLQKDDNIFQYLKEYHTIYTDSGRSASTILNHILEQGTILLPNYICESVINSYQNYFDIQYYKVYKDLTIDIEDLESKIDESVTAVYVMHYFGQLQGIEVCKALQSLREKYGFVIIEDTTHSIYTKKSTIGDYCICSLRKWFPIMDGGVLYSKKDLSQIPLENIEAKAPGRSLEAMILKKLFIEGELECNACYRKIFVEEEEKLDKQQQPYLISEVSKSMLKCFSIEELIAKRKTNLNNIYKKLNKGGNESPLQGNDFVALAYPLYVEERDEFRKFLMEHRIYCAVHWPLAGTELENDADSKWISEHIISLPIDQRYDESHMLYMLEVIDEYKKTCE